MIPSLRLKPHYGIKRAKILTEFSPIDILMKISKATGVHIIFIAGKSQKRKYVIVRQYYCYYSWLYTRHSLKEIAAQIGGRDHSTIIHGRDTIADLLMFDKKTKADIANLDKLFSGYKVIRKIPSN